MGVDGCVVRWLVGVDGCEGKVFGKWVDGCVVKCSVGMDGCVGKVFGKWVDGCVVREKSSLSILHSTSKPYKNRTVIIHAGYQYLLMRS